MSETSFRDPLNAAGPEPIPNFAVRRDVLEHMPPIHRMAAELAIKSGRWRLVE